MARNVDPVSEVKRRIIWGIVVLAGAIFIATVSSGHGATARNLKQIPIEEDAFLNYDFLSKDHSRHNVDWAISLLFWNNAEVDAVKDALGYLFPKTGGAKYAYINNGNGWKWDQDSGRKGTKCPTSGETMHYRIYAPPADSFYNDRWGYYSLGSIHYDINECNIVDLVVGNVVGTFGYSEEAEEILAGIFELEVGQGTVREDALWFRNFQRKEWDGRHFWENDGFATKLRMPAHEGVSIS